MARFGEIVLWMIATSAKLRKKTSIALSKMVFYENFNYGSKKKLFIFRKTKPVFSFGAKLSTLVKKIEIFSQTLCIWTTFETTKIWK
jgi:hypothetical protein